MKAYLTGFMASGKTTVGRLVADLFEPKWEFIDLDLEIEKLAGKSIPEIFASEGEPQFRQREAAALAKVAARHAEGSVIATGGGVILSPQNRDLMRRTGIVIWLDVPFEVAVKRHKESGHEISRPLLDDLEAAAKIYESRLPLYQATADLRVPGSDSAEMAGPEDIARDIWLRLKKALTEEPVNVLDSYDIAIRPGLIDSCGDAIVLGERSGRGATGPGIRKAVVITEESVSDLYWERVRDSLTRCGFQPLVFLHPGGEAAKSLRVASAAYDFLAENGATRDTYILALGGGVTGDLAGFVAATYMRGVPLVQIPTTLLAQVDASVGGKVAVNHRLGKNLIGTFYQPLVCIVDPLVLRSLPEESYKEGLAEVVKYAVIEGDEFIDWLEGSAPRILRRDAFVLSEMVRRCCSIKARIVSMDERDHGLRQWLNLGHTFAHAVESVLGYAGTSHGYAVAVGLVWACKLSEMAGICVDRSLRGKVERLLIEFGLPLDLEALLARRPGVPKGEELKRAILKAMALDKKARGGKVRFVLPRYAGRLEIAEDIDEDVVREAINAVAEARTPDG